MSANYDSTNVGVPYLRCNNITIQYPPNAVPIVTVSQANAVKLADNTVVEISQAKSFYFSPDMINNATTPIPLVDPTSGAALGATITLQTLMLGILAAIRLEQDIVNT